MENDANITSDLLFKKQDKFWDRYYELRDEANTNLSKLYTCTDVKPVDKFFSTMGELLNWCSSYQTKHINQDSSKLIHNLRELAKEWRAGINSIWSKEESKNNFIAKCQEFWDKVAEEHKKQELLPRPEEVYEQDNLFRKAMKEASTEAEKQMLKAVDDIYRGSIKTFER